MSNEDEEKRKKKIAYLKEWRKANAEKVKTYNKENYEKILVRNRAYKEKNREELNAKQRTKHAANPEKERERSKKNREKYPEKANARWAIRLAIRRGEIKRPNKCSRCGKKCAPDGHHHSYEEKYWLDVEWLCRQCHSKEHRAQEKKKKDAS